MHENCIAVCKKSTSSSAAEHQLSSDIRGPFGHGTPLSFTTFNQDYIFFVSKWYPPSGACDSVMGPGSFLLPMYALHTISFVGVVEEIHGWSQEPLRRFNVTWNITWIASVSNPSLFYLCMQSCTIHQMYASLWLIYCLESSVVDTWP